MAIDRVNFYLQQLVTEADLDGAFDDVEDAVKNLAIDSGARQAQTTDTPDLTEHGGILSGLVVTDPGAEQAAVSVGYARDATGKRIYLGSAATISLLYAGACDQGDYTAAEGDGASIKASCPSGNYIIASLYIVFDQYIHDDVVDGAGTPLKYSYDQSFHFDIQIGTAGVPASTRAALSSSKVLLTDLLLYNNSGTLEIAGICNSNTDWDALSGLDSSYASITGRRSDFLAFDNITTYLRFNEAGVSRRYASSRHAIGGMLADLQRSGSTPAGAQLIGARAQSGSVSYGTGGIPLSLSAASLDAQLLALCNAINSRVPVGGIIPCAFYDDFNYVPTSGTCGWDPDTDSGYWGGINVGTPGAIIELSASGSAVILTTPASVGQDSGLALGCSAAYGNRNMFAMGAALHFQMAVRFGIGLSDDTIFEFGLTDGTGFAKVIVDAVAHTTIASISDPAGANIGNSTSVWSALPLTFKTLVAELTSDKTMTLRDGYTGTPVTATSPGAGFAPSDYYHFYFRAISKTGGNPGIALVDAVSIGELAVR